jgi:Reverse transcriptase (RNA-dependent DNA polymerase)
MVGSKDFETGPAHYQGDAKWYFRTNQKYGIELPHSVKRALQIDKETGTTFWQNALQKEMKVVMVAFKILEQGAERPVGYEKVHCHLVFDIKMGTLQWKARYVCGGHTTNPAPEIQTYASVVSRESVRITFTLAALNDLDIQLADVSNAYLNAPSRERLVTKCGPDFGKELQGRWAIIKRALYGCKSAAASWRASIIGLLEQLGFKMCQANNNVMMRAGSMARATLFGSMSLSTQTTS